MLTWIDISLKSEPSTRRDFSNWRGKLKKGKNHLFLFFFTFLVSKKLQNLQKAKCIFVLKVKKAPKNLLKTHIFKRIGGNRMINESSDVYRIKLKKKSHLYLVTDCRGHVRISKLLGPLVIFFLEII